MFLVAAGAGVFWYISRFSEKPADPFVVVLPIRNAPSTRPMVEGFIKKMEELGYKEGVDVVYKRTEYLESTPEGLAQIRDLYQSYIAEDPDIIMTLSNLDTKMVLEETKKAGKPIAIVAGDITDPVEEGMATSWKSSGNNLTGVAENRNAVIEKALSLFTKTKPGIKKIGVATDGYMVPGPAAPGGAYLKALRMEANKLGIEIVEYKTTVPPGPQQVEELKTMLNNIKEGEVDAWVHIPAHLFANQQAFEHEMAVRIKAGLMLPAIEYNNDTNEPIGLFAYGSDFNVKGQQVAVFADKILRKGSSVSDLPLELPLKYNVVVHLGTAKAIGITVPKEILEIADTAFSE
ncbi:MAG: ABC transporter substrate-binding protein [Candidatus Wildermuthbacteria bacterium]|nr:ABC transporter substrate-binding protein [Candidatus Wildermuthbacteria bacterium]